MKRHVLNIRAVDRINFDQIAEGKKTIETRAATPRYNGIEAGDELELRCGTDRITRRVLAVQHYDSVESIFQSADFSSVMPGVETLDDAKAAYYSYSGYEDKINRYGLIAMYLE